MRLIPQGFLYRYAIDDGARDWSEAEKHVAALASGKKGLGTVVSLKSTKVPERKRKAAGEDEAQGRDSKTRKKTRRGPSKGTKA